MPCCYASKHNDLQSYDVRFGGAWRHDSKRKKKGKWSGVLKQKTQKLLPTPAIEGC